MENTVYNKMNMTIGKVWP